MSIIPPADADYLRQVFAERLSADVSIVLYSERQSGLIVQGEECPTCKDTQRLMEEVAALSDRIHLEVRDLFARRKEATRDGVTEIPSILIRGANQGALRYVGAPAGYEFAGFVESLIAASTGATGLSQRTRELLGALQQPVHVKIFVTPT